jgi:hypothetical protein
MTDRYNAAYKEISTFIVESLENYPKSLGLRFRVNIAVVPSNQVYDDQDTCEEKGCIVCKVAVKGHDNRRQHENTSQNEGSAFEVVGYFFQLDHFRAEDDHQERSHEQKDKVNPNDNLSRDLLLQHVVVADLIITQSSRCLPRTARSQR